MIELYDAWKLLILQSGSSPRVMVLTAYLDDSGDYEDPANRIVCVAGCVSPEDTWRELTEEWNAVLKKPEFNVDYSHMREYAHSSNHSKFQSWKGNEVKRKAFLSELMDIMDRKVMGVVGATVPIKVFDMLTPEQKNRIGDPLALCVQGAFHGCNALGWTYRSKINVRFSCQAKYKNRIETIFNYLKDNSPIGGSLGDYDMQNMRETPALQAADIVAYELHDFAKTLSQPGEGKIRTPMKRLFRENYFFTFYDYNSLIKGFYVSGPGFQEQQNGK